ncbi:fungal-specific transcription factor domain-domain-containing protein [Microdochium bolleyi]|uniref:Fungal-specific transcription factor domain-domain-containing protein n=1 Tax=Microdochium bolleyi TaxID=196109 RepID=A0A136ILT6_9PEZI|nr:fungal-specific transcription factor domain-domain-containing protein [Microdochium bolleyi]
MSGTDDRRVPDWASALPQDRNSRPGKRSRVALACQRCKTRKQKCNGTNPCAKCEALDLPCEYVVPQKPMPFGKNQYIKSLERRVAELETLLSVHGLAEPSKDHWGSYSKASDQAGSQHAGDTPNTDGDDVETEWQDGESVTSIFHSLALDANGQAYTGATSHNTMGRLLGTLLQSQARRASTFSTAQSGRGSRQNSVSMTSPPPPSQRTEAEAEATPADAIDFSEVPDDVADRLLRGYWKHIGTRFPVLYSHWLRDVHERSRRQSLADDHESSLLHLAYAVAGRFLETTGETGPFYPRRHLAAALEHVDGILGPQPDHQSVAALVLLAVYCLRDPAGPGAWAYIRLAATTVVELGLHRKSGETQRPSLRVELNRRLFWAVYSFDRQISIPLGRPFAIPDRDIDVPLPLDVDESTTSSDFDAMEAAPDSEGMHPTSTSLSSFILLARLRQIESDIQQAVYRVDCDAEIAESEVQLLLDRLDHWRELIPQDASAKRDQSHLDATPYDGYELYMIHYFKSKRLLLYPQLSRTPINPKLLKECALACAGVSTSHKRIHQTMAIGYSLMALQTVFMAGITLVYCLWISPVEVFDLATSNGIHDCSIVLFVISERVPAARKYRNAFEVIRQRVMDLLSDTRTPPQPRMAMPAGLANELASSTESFVMDRPFGSNDLDFEQFSHIMSDMSGDMFPAPDTMAIDPFHPMSIPDDYSISPTAIFDYSNVEPEVPPGAHETASLAAWFAAANAGGQNQDVPP